MDSERREKLQKIRGLCGQALLEQRSYDEVCSEIAALVVSGRTRKKASTSTKDRQQKGGKDRSR